MYNPVKHNKNPQVSQVEKELTVEDVAKELVKNFEKCLDTLEDGGIPIGVYEIQRDDETPSKIANAAASVPEDMAELIQINPNQFAARKNELEKDILVTNRVSDFGKVSTFFLVEMDGPKLKRALFSQEVNGLNFHQETTIKFDEEDARFGMIVNPGKKEDAKIITDPNLCLQAMDHAIAHSVQPVERVIVESTEEFDQLEVPSIEVIRKNRLAAAATAFIHPERVAA